MIDIFVTTKQQCLLINLLRISNKRTAFFLLDQLSITLICVPSYDRSYNVYLFPIGL